MKKAIFVLCVALLAVMLCACGAGDVGSKEYMANKEAASQAEQAQEEASKGDEPVWEESFDGLMQCFEWRGYVNADSKTQTAAEVVGANDGYRYTAPIPAGNANFNLELYYYDPEQPLENSAEFISQIRNNGYFELLDTQIPAVVSDNGKYMMVYSNILNEEVNTPHKEEIYNVLKNFK